MDDLISRQQAIDALIRVPGIGNRALDKIRELPSAQPEELDTLIKALERRRKGEPMSDMMTFPATVEEFMEQYKIVDDEKVYTNGADLVPIFRMMQWFEHVSATDTISRQAAIMDAESWVAVDEYEKNLQKKVVEWLKEFPPAELGTNLTEEYARAVRNWLVNYQVKCADLAGRYTPYEVLGWIVSDWRKENGIW